ncbi:Luminal-binding protein 5 [Ceratobasidium theobromae]|uniref:Luminal-binding protein 5 n=1 Tax=Ceratobasidium theobromae TaxID=1582974 RepID=A0A5N5QPZ8_9AGAM|nr:Luminal-binding protein 5 [Ceratobasidium theobromae]
MFAAIPFYDRSQNPNGTSRKLWNGNSDMVVLNHPSMPTPAAIHGVAGKANPSVPLGEYTVASQLADSRAPSPQPVLRPEESYDDPVKLGILPEDSVMGLFFSFHTALNPVIALLDPTLHTPIYVRRRSRVLYTAILAAACRFFKPACYKPIHDLAQILLGRALADGVSSVEFIQALVIMTFWKEADDTSTWRKLGLAIRMGFELNLHHANPNPIPQDELQARERLNEERTWLHADFMIVTCVEMVSHCSLFRSIRSVVTPSNRVPMDLFVRHVIGDGEKFVSTWPFENADPNLSPVSRSFLRFHHMRMKLALTELKFFLGSTPRPGTSHVLLMDCVNTALAILRHIITDFAPNGYLAYGQDLIPFPVAYAGAWLFRQLPALDEPLGDTIIETFRSLSNACKTQPQITGDTYLYYNRFFDHLVEHAALQKHDLIGSQISNTTAKPSNRIGTDENSISSLLPSCDGMDDTWHLAIDGLKHCSDIHVFYAFRLLFYDDVKKDSAVDACPTMAGAAKTAKPEEKAPERKGPAVIGINFGNAYASIAIINNEGQPDCIANEDGERQNAAAVSYFGLEEYIGNQAKPQLVKNSQNTITNFRNQLGKKFSEVTQAGPSTSAPIIDHQGEPAYKVTVLVPAPPPSVAPTPKATPLPTRPASPVPQEKILTVHDVSVLFLKSLLQSAVDFLGRSVDGAVLSVNNSWDDSQRAALKRAAEEAGIKVLQLLDEAVAATLAYSSAPSPENPSHPLKSGDKTTLVLDLGAASLSLSLLSSKQGLYHVLSSTHSSTVGGDSIDDLLLTHFGKEFTKKTKIPVALPCTTPGAPDQRADAKMRLAIEHTKRTISASPGVASCAVESLKDGMDFSGSLNRLRFDMLVDKVYAAVIDEVSKLLGSSGVDATLVDEVILVGGSAALPGLADRLAGLFGDNATIRSELDPSQVLARGCAVQAQLALASQNDAFAQGVSAPVTSKVLGLVFAGDDSAENWIPIVAAETPLPCRRVVRLPVPPGKIGFELWEAVDAVDVKKVPVEQDEDEEEEPEEEEIRTRIVKKESALGGCVVDVQGKKGAKFIVQAIVSVEGRVDVSAWEEGTENRAGFTVGA